MAFDAETKKTINAYVSAHVADEAWHVAYFDFIGNATLAQRLGEEFISTRYIYKILEGLEADDWMLRSQIRLQVLSYASIYEAVLHHLLFDCLDTEPRVIALTEFPTKKQISIPPASLALLEKHLEHDGKKIIPTYEAVGRTDYTKVRFDKKAECAAALGMIEPWLKDELIEFYEARNAIHIHAEIRKSLNYQLDLSKRAYLRMQPFKEQLSAWRSAYVV
ncbi:hypothetical protein [Pseudomonas sp. PLB05]|uniref:hypothetical protein n=1 Tax=Pseudomonas sp. PLB05 TaxID=2899078 RepID=UPI001E540220|nr:hypothetical protein [Pseudomonas sp. PLB05]MCD4863535.1 hypothetical protein [Pseudomonas sp. PLB05]